MLNIDDPDTVISTPPLWRLPFRPFFLFGALFSLLAVSWWSFFWTSPFHWSPYGNPVWWHSHEMIFGFGAAIITGFLLTAVQTWTGVKGLSGWPLALLVLLWITARILLFLPFHLPGSILLVIDTAFLVFAAVAMAYPVFKVRQKRNMPFPFILLIFASLNAASHYGLLASKPEISQRSIYAAVMVIMLVISIIGGRVIPFFTANATDYARKPGILLLEILSIGTFPVLVILAGLGFGNTPSVFMLTVCLTGGIAHFCRWLRWGGSYTFKTPLLWSLHIAYAFIPAGLFLLALWKGGIIQNLSTILHVFTTGAMGTMILAMISRVSLGHTGRPLKPPAMISLSFCLVILSALARTAIPLITPGLYLTGIGLSGFLWALAFGLFVIYYTPVLTKPRIDNKDG